jgi:Altronate dehydratase
MALPHPYGRLQFGADLDLHFRTLIGAGSNPNVAAVVVIGIEEGWTKRVVDGIAKTGKPVMGFGIELHGDHDTIMRASKGERNGAVRHVARSRGVPDLGPVGLHQMRRVGHHLGLRCEPDGRQCFRQAVRLGTTLVSARPRSLRAASRSSPRAAANDGVRERFQFMFDRYQDMINRWKTDDLSESQPTKGNIAGG